MWKTLEILNLPYPPSNGAWVGGRTKMSTWFMDGPYEGWCILHNQCDGLYLFVHILTGSCAVLNEISKMTWSLKHCNKSWICLKKICAEAEAFLPSFATVFIPISEDKPMRGNCPCHVFVASLWILRWCRGCTFAWLIPLLSWNDGGGSGVNESKFPMDIGLTGN